MLNHDRKVQVKDIVTLANIYANAGKVIFIFCSWDVSAYSFPVLINPSLLSEFHEFNDFKVGKKSFIIFTMYNAEDSFGSVDLFISRRNVDGTVGLLKI